ncbi:hypothetical protein [Rhodococcus sp. USK10]|uniref:hypothetical protein n=1 Tax=Rhodococcus sp. USK10 TaxID=2789739 RepID=UPI002150F3F7|nr:hypothetical protein [Rhodococcus sp. USK10]
MTRALAHCANPAARVLEVDDEATERSLLLGAELWECRKCRFGGLVEERHLSTERDNADLVGAGADAVLVAQPIEENDDRV